MRPIKNLFRRIDAGESLDVKAEVDVILDDADAPPSGRTNEPSPDGPDPDVTPDPDATPDPDNAPDTEVEEVATPDADAIPANPPTVRRTPQPTSTTTKIASSSRRAHVSGRVADAHVRADLEAEYPNDQVTDLRVNGGADNGVDHLVIKRDADGAISELINVESKGTGATSGGSVNLTDLQARGPREHLEATVAKMDRGDPLKRELEGYLGNQDNLVTGQIRTSRVVPETGELVSSGRQDWVKETTSYPFKLDTPRGGTFVDADKAMQDAFAAVGNTSKHGRWADQLDGWLSGLDPARRQGFFDNIPWLNQHFDPTGIRI